MKKMFALLLALMMALTCVSAFADTIYTKVAIDRDVAAGVMTGFGIEADAQGMLDPVIALINALGTNVTLVDDGAQIDLDLNGKDALSLGLATDANGLTVASSLFPNYLVTVKPDTLSDLAAQMSANVPGANGASMEDMAAMGEIFGGYFQKWMEACAAAGKPGDPVSGDYEFEGYKFDNMVPITVDIPAIAEATKDLRDELMNDPAAMAAIKGMAQGAAQNSGEAFDPDKFEEEFKAGFDEWLAHFPESAEAEFYCNSDSEEAVPFYLVGQGEREGNVYAYDMLFIEETNMSMGFAMTGDQEIIARFAMEGEQMSMYFSMGEIYFGLAFGPGGNQFFIDVYFMNDEAPLASITITNGEGGERTLSMDASGKTVLALEDIMSDESGDAVQGLMGDIMMNGLGTLMGTVSSEVPELAGLMSMGMAG